MWQQLQVETNWQVLIWSERDLPQICGSWSYFDVLKFPPPTYRQLHNAHGASFKQIWEMHPDLGQELDHNPPEFNVLSWYLMKRKTSFELAKRHAEMNVEETIRLPSMLQRAPLKKDNLLQERS